MLSLQPIQTRALESSVCSLKTCMMYITIVFKHATKAFCIGERRCYTPEPTRPTIHRHTAQSPTICLSPRICTLNTHEILAPMPHAEDGNRLYDVRPPVHLSVIYPKSTHPSNSPAISLFPYICTLNIHEILATMPHAEYGN